MLYIIEYNYTTNFFEDDAKLSLRCFDCTGPGQRGRGGGEEAERRVRGAEEAEGRLGLVCGWGVAGAPGLVRLCPVLELFSTFP